MKRAIFIGAVSLLALSQPATAQVYAQPLDEVSHVVVTANMQLNVVCGNKTQLVADSPDDIATEAYRTLTLDGNSTAVLHIATSNCPVHFSAENGAILSFKGPFDFGDNNLHITASDNARIELSAPKGDTLSAKGITFEAKGNAAITCLVPIRTNGYQLKSSDNSLIDIQELILPDSNVAAHGIDIADNGKITFRKSAPKAYSISSTAGEKQNKARRHLEVSYSWGWNNWGHSPLTGVGGVDGDAAVVTNFDNIVFQLDYPVFNRRHVGLYVGLGFEDNTYHFEAPLVNYTQPSFTAAATSTVVNISGSDPDNWKTLFSTLAITLPITLSTEPCRYKGLCFRLSVIPGVHLRYPTGLSQHYETSTVNVSVTDVALSKQINTYMLDARLAVFYRSLGVYFQSATLPLLRSGNDRLYPVKFGFVWTITGR